MPFAHVLRTSPPEEALALQPQPYFNHAVALKKRFMAAERAQMLEAVSLNVFYFPAPLRHFKARFAFGPSERGHHLCSNSRQHRPPLAP